MLWNLLVQPNVREFYRGLELLHLTHEGYQGTHLQGRIFKGSCSCCWIRPRRIHSMALLGKVVKVPPLVSWKEQCPMQGHCSAYIRVHSVSTERVVGPCSNATQPVLEASVKRRKGGDICRGTPVAHLSSWNHLMHCLHSSERVTSFPGLSNATN